MAGESTPLKGSGTVPSYESGSISPQGKGKALSPTPTRSNLGSSHTVEPLDNSRTSATLESDKNAQMQQTAGKVNKLAIAGSIGGVVLMGAGVASFGLGMVACVVLLPSGLPAIAAAVTGATIGIGLIGSGAAMSGISLVVLNNEDKQAEEQAKQQDHGNTSSNISPAPRERTHHTERQEPDVPLTSPGRQNVARNEPRNEPLKPEDKVKAYKLLELPDTASEKDFKEAYDKKGSALSPDDKFEAIRVYWDILQREKGMAS